VDVFGLPHVRMRNVNVELGREAPSCRVPARERDGAAPDGGFHIPARETTFSEFARTAESHDHVPGPRKVLQLLDEDAL